MKCKRIQAVEPKRKEKKQKKKKTKKEREKKKKSTDLTPEIRQEACVA